LYNHDSHYNPLQNITVKLPDLGYSIAGQNIASAKLHDINITDIQFATLKGGRLPGFKASFTIETGGPKEIDIDTITDSGDIDIKSLIINPQIALVSLDSVDKSSLNEWGKNYALSFLMNFEMHPNIVVEYPDVSASVEFNRDDLVKLDFDVEWVRKNLNDLMNNEVSKGIENKLNKFKKRVIEYLLGEAYPIVDIKQVNDNMQITYVANPEDEAFLQINQPSPYKPPATNNLSKIDHIVVLMMENRSFDQMLGYLKVLEGRTDVDGLKGDEFNMHIDRFSHSNRKYQVFHSTKTDINDDPCHAFYCMTQQIGANMNGFVDSLARKIDEGKIDPSKPGELDNYYHRLLNVMRYYGKVELPTNDFIANEYAICDRWFCSHPGQTQPNRFISYTGKLNKSRSGEIEVDNPDFGTFNPVETYTIFDYLTQCKVPWKVFEHGYSLTRMFAKYTFDTTNIVDFNNPNLGFKASLRNIPGSNKTNFPSVAFIEPDYIDVPPGADDHPPSDVKNGQKFIAGVIKELQQSGIWEKCALIITYDESGGFYDHVLPPNNAIPLKQGITRYGPRVPSFVISPYIPAKTVSHELYDHTSILATIIRRFIRPELHDKLDLGPRLRSANDLGSVLSLSQPRKNVRQISIPTYPVAIPPNYRMSLPSLTDSDFHELLFGYRLIMGYPPK
jgi:phospholipase C